MRIIAKKNYILFHADCLEAMDYIKDASIDLILCDLPYGTTANKWDTIIPFKQLWSQYWRLVKLNTPILLTTTQPFTTKIINSCIRDFKYNWCWIKENGTGFLNAKKQPLRVTEDILVFYQKQCCYNPIMRLGFKPYNQTNGRHTTNYGKQNLIASVSSGERYPINVLTIARDKLKVHPTQKPVALMEYMIKTYTNPGAIVLDNCMGSGTTGVAALNLGRFFIGIEKDEKYFEIAAKRIVQTAHELRNK